MNAAAFGDKTQLDNLPEATVRIYPLTFVWPIHLTLGNQALRSDHQSIFRPHGVAGSGKMHL